MANTNQSIIETSFNRWKNTLLQTNPGARGSLILRLLDRFGIRNADDLIYFLNSPEGKTLEADIAIEIARLIAERDAQVLAYQQEEIRQERFLGYLLIAEMEREAAHRSQQSIDSMAQLAKSQPDQTRAERVKEYETLLDHYNKAELGLKNKLATQEASLQSINDNIKQLESVKSTLQKVTAALPNGWQEAIEAAINQLNKEPLSLEEKINRLRVLQGAESDHEEDQLLVDNVMDDIRSSDSSDNERVSKLLTRELKAQQIHDSFSYQNGYKKAYSENGEPLSSLSSAAYIVPSSLELARKDNKLHLIPAGESIDNLSPSELEAAHEKFKSHEPEIRTANQYLNTFNDLLSHASQILLEVKAFRIQQVQAIHDTKENIAELQQVKTTIQEKIKKAMDEPLEPQKEADDNLIPANLRSLLKPVPSPSSGMRRITPPTQKMRVAAIEDAIIGILRQRDTRKQFLQSLMLNEKNIEGSSSLRSPFDITPHLFKP